MINPFVLKATEASSINGPDIEVELREQYGQLSEDIIVDGLLSAWALRADVPLSNFRYLEIGANHPYATSTTFLLQRLYGMTGVLVEANEDLLPSLRMARPKDKIEYKAATTKEVDAVDFYVANKAEVSSLSRDFVEQWPDGAVRLSEVRKVPAVRVNSLLEQHFSDVSPVFLSVDVEGLDLEIIRDIDWQRWRPVVVQVEPSDHFVSKQSDAIISFMREKSYALVAKTQINLIFQDSHALLHASGVKENVRRVSSEVSPTATFLSPRYRYGSDASVGIVMRTKNREVLLRRALESVKWQTYSLWQLVVVNDGGDPVLVDELVQHVFGDDCRVSVINHPISVGMEAASNAGLSHLRTELAIIHDDDDSWAPDMLKVLTAVLRERNALFPSVRGVVSRVNWVQETVAGNHIEIESIQPWNDGSRDRLTEGLIKLHRLAMQNLFPPIAFLFDLSLARELGCFDQELPVQGDWDFHLRFAGAADIWVHPELLAFYHHRRNATGDMENTVVSGKAKHDLYNTFLRNRYLRDANSPMAAAMATLREYGLEIQLVHDKQAHIHWDLNNSQNGPRAKEKSKLAKALSRLNRQRKRLKIKEFFRGLS